MEESQGEEAQGPQEETVEDYCTRVLGGEIERLEKLKDDPKSGLEARAAIAMLRPFFEFVIEESRRGVSGSKLAKAVGAFFGNATFILAANSSDPQVVAKQTSDTMMARLMKRFGVENPGPAIRAARPGLILPGAGRGGSLTPEELTKVRGG